MTLRSTLCFDFLFYFMFRPTRLEFDKRAFSTLDFRSNCEMCLTRLGQNISHKPRPGSDIALSELNRSFLVNKNQKLIYNHFAFFFPCSLKPCFAAILTRAAKQINLDKKSQIINKKFRRNRTSYIGNTKQWYSLIKKISGFFFLSGPINIIM